MHMWLQQHTKTLCSIWMLDALCMRCAYLVSSLFLIITFIIITFIIIIIIINLIIDVIWFPYCRTSTS